MVNGHDLADQQRILDLRAQWRHHIAILQALCNRCAWCGEARVEPGQPLCLRCGHFVTLDDIPDPA